MTAPSDRSGAAAEDPREQARRLMRQGLDDEVIEAITGLHGLEILDIRARASVAEEPVALRRRPDGETG